MAWAMRALITELNPTFYRVVGIATNPTKAMQLARECEPDVVLVDIRLENNTSGVDLVRQLGPLSIPSIYITAYRGDAVRLPGSLGCLLKPFCQDDIRLVLLAVQEILRGQPVGPLPNSFVLY